MNIRYFYIDPTDEYNAHIENLWTVNADQMISFELDMSYVKKKLEYHTMYTLLSNKTILTIRFPESYVLEIIIKYIEKHNGIPFVVNEITHIWNPTTIWVLMLINPDVEKSFNSIEKSAVSDTKLNNVLDT